MRCSFESDLYVGADIMCSINNGRCALSDRIGFNRAVFGV